MLVSSNHEVLSFELAHNTFQVMMVLLDSVIQNGYAFTDRYDIAR